LPHTYVAGTGILDDGQALNFAKYANRILVDSSATSRQVLGKHFAI